jgi:5'-phosphate synthase pdxT subunit
MDMPFLVGVLALQGDVPEHLQVLRSLLGEDGAIEVREPDDLARVRAIMLPGGESTTLSRLLDETGLREPLKKRGEQGLAILATCAGLILIAKDVERSPSGRDPVPLSLLDISVKRNDYGRQVESFEAPVDIKGLTGGRFPAAFIRAPRIVRVGKGVKVLSSFHGSPIMVRRGNIWGLTFHPEIGDDWRIHRQFLADAGIPLSIE